MALYERDYTSTEIGYVQEGASISFMKQTYWLLATSMLTAAAGAYLTLPYVNTIMQFKWPLFIFVNLMLWFGFGLTRNKPILNIISLFIFTLATGVMLVPMIVSFLGAGKGAVIGNAFLMTAVLFGALSLFALNSKKDYSSWGKPLVVTMFVVFISALVNVLFFHSPIFSVIFSSAWLLIFGLFTIYDTQNIANGAYSSPIDAAISLYVDFFNMFTSMLHLLGIFGSDD